MGNCCAIKTPSADTLPPSLAALVQKREIMEKDKIPRLKPYEVNPAILAVATKPAGGPNLFDMYDGYKHKLAHPPDFVCYCRVSKTSTDWRYIKPDQCDRWVENGDLLVSECERVIRKHNIVGNGKEKLNTVYAILEKQGV